MPNWFSVYQKDDWEPQKHSYNELFSKNIAELRSWFRTERVAFGIDQGTGQRIPYSLQGKDYTVEMVTFTWGDYRLVTNRNRVDSVSETSYITPILIFKLKIRKRIGWTVFDRPIITEFDPFFPRTPPRYRINDKRYAFKDQDWYEVGKHHIHNGGWLCIMGGGYGGYSRSEWDPQKGNVLVGLNQALELVIWHVNNFGW